MSSGTWGIQAGRFSDVRLEVHHLSLRGESVRGARDVARVGQGQRRSFFFQAGKDMDGVPGDVPGSGVGSLETHEDVES